MNISKNVTGNEQQNNFNTNTATPSSTIYNKTNPGQSQSQVSQINSQISRGQFKVNSTDTERGEANSIAQINLKMTSSLPSQKPQGSTIAPKNNLQATGSNILHQDESALQGKSSQQYVFDYQKNQNKNNLLKKKSELDQSIDIQKIDNNQGNNKKNPFSQRRQTAQQQNNQFSDNNKLDEGSRTVSQNKITNEPLIRDEEDSSDDSDDFNNFYTSNQEMSSTKKDQKSNQNQIKSSFDQNVRKFHGDQNYGNNEHIQVQNNGGYNFFNQNTGGHNQLNRNMSQSQLSDAAYAVESSLNYRNDVQKEVEVKAQSENSQLFQDSIMQSNNNNQSQNYQNQRKSRLGYGGGGSSLQGAGSSIIQGNQNFQGFQGINKNGQMNSDNLGMDMKVNLNLEDVVLHEQKLSIIVENLRNDVNASLSCEDWWDLTETTDLYDIVINKLIKDIQLRQLMIQAQKYETISIGIVQFYHLIASELETIDTKTSVNIYLKNLIHYIHQNFLVIAKFINSRITMSKEEQLNNVWIQNLKKAVDQKIVKNVKNKSEAVQMLRGNIENSQNIFKNIIKANQKKQFFTVLNNFLQKLPLFSNAKIRETLYNIEQFKFDALLKPEIKMNLQSSQNTSQQTLSSKLSQSQQSKSQSANNQTGKDQDKSQKQGQQEGALSKKMIKDSDKSSGTNNLVGTGNGNSTLTGKNPFAILKASAIAATQKAVFPNNFTNLPKVVPPFLPALEGKDKESLYTLVLDLDETLIHNVEYGQDSFFLVRPGCVQFIELMAQYYEIVIFTAALQEYADQVVDQIDVNKNIKYRLYRQHTSQNGPFLVKDLSLLGRDLNRTIIIDNISDNFILQPDNGIFISTWYDDMQDNFLKEISPLLVELVDKKVPDVRVGMRSFRDQILRQISSGQTSIMPSIQFK